jgi:hypothetical protein
MVPRTPNLTDWEAPGLGRSLWEHLHLHTTTPGSQHVSFMHSVPNLGAQALRGMNTHWA